jgi:hypothetical protein
MEWVESPVPTILNSSELLKSFEGPDCAARSKRFGTIPAFLMARFPVPILRAKLRPQDFRHQLPYNRSICP